MGGRVAVRSALVPFMTERCIVKLKALRCNAGPIDAHGRRFVPGLCAEGIRLPSEMGLAVNFRLAPYRPVGNCASSVGMLRTSRCETLTRLA